MMQHKCIKCGSSYESEDTDAYYCDSCNEEKLAIAKRIDAQVAARPSKRGGPSFDEQMAQYETRGGITMINLPK